MVLGLLLHAALMLPAPLPSDPGRVVKSVQIGSAQREVLFLIPSKFSRTKKMPFVVLLHGFTGSGPIIDYMSGFSALAEKEGFVLAAPTGIGNPAGWNCDILNLGKPGEDDFAFISGLIDRAGTELNIDRKRVFVAGHSNGAMMSNALAGRFSTKIAAIGAVAGVIGVGPLGKEKMIAMPTSPVSVLHIHAKDDRMVAYDRTGSAFVKGINAPEAAAWWAKANGISSAPSTITEPWGSRIIYKSPRSEVQLITLIQGGHDWPRNTTQSPGSIHATTEIWNFFKRNPKR